MISVRPPAHMLMSETDDRHSLVTAVNTLDPARNLEEGMTKPYAKGLRINTVFGKYARRYWRAGTQE